MSILSRAGISIAVAQVRLVDQSMRSHVERVIGEDVWSGPDADRFAQEWESLVSARLRSAAQRLETIDLNPFS